MHFGKTLGTACSSFAITNIDNIFVLVTFFAEASTSKTLTPLKIVAGQYVGFTVITTISMIGFGVALVLPPEPIGFLGFLPILLGIWKLIDLCFPARDAEGSTVDEGDDEETKKFNIDGMKSVFKVSLVTVMNGGDNVGTYIPLFSQAKGAEIAVYIVTYYILLGVWCLAGFLIMKQKHVLRVAQKYADLVIPFLYIGLGIFITVKSSCFPWSIKHIDDSLSSRPGKIIMGVVSAVFLLACMGPMLWFKLRKRVARGAPDARDVGREEEAAEDGQGKACDVTNVNS
ncbi:cadmium resistance transporter-domain-containing protein [Phaeosphaeriaceae sp. PMI808]|nr:cadmium resistance transporter-domain-containing protein [Phaeosphaeriaceae sp. PMI808]